MKYNTDKKNEIIAFFERNGEDTFTIEELCSLILKDGQGKSTVYRIISGLVDEGTLRRIADVKTRRVSYQYIHKKECHEHLHLKCKDCGRLIHLDESISKTLGTKIFDSKGFVLDEGTLLYGRCEGCIKDTEGDRI